MFAPARPYPANYRSTELLGGQFNVHCRASGIEGSKCALSGIGSLRFKVYARINVDKVLLMAAVC